jgi:DNA-binding XRE family transcriptional regulator
MSALTIDYQTITRKGKPEFAVVPYDEFIRLLHPNANIPHEVVGLVVRKGYSLARAWREHLSLTQAQVAKRLGITQAALSQLEAPGRRWRKKTLDALATALKLQPDQLQE